jgi:mono/diheme cytochrome c family protein
VVWLALCLLLPACQQQMARQPSYRPLRHSNFFGDARSARPLVEGTVPRGELRADTHLYAGKMSAEVTDPARAAGLVGVLSGSPLAVLGWATDEPLYADTFPEPVTKDVLERGQQRYEIYCSVCHDRVGSGKGMIVQRGFTQPPSYHTDLSRGYKLRGIHLKLRDAPVGYYYEVITNGFGAMPDYAAQVPPKDRWAIIAYIRALQFSQNATLADVTDEKAKAKLLQTRGGK